MPHKDRDARLAYLRAWKARNRPPPVPAPQPAPGLPPLGVAATRRGRTMTPIDDPRPFSEVLRDWMARHQLDWPGAMHLLGMASRQTLANALAGRPIRYERAQRALMTLVDEGRA